MADKTLGDRLQVLMKILRYKYDNFRMLQYYSFFQFAEIVLRERFSDLASYRFWASQSRKSYMYEFADRYGISYSTIIRYKQNDRRPDSDFLSQLSRDGVNANWLLTGEGEMFLEEAAFVFGSRLRQKTLELIHPWKAKLMHQEQVNTRVIVLSIEGQIPAGTPLPIEPEYDISKYATIFRFVINESNDSENRHGEQFLLFQCCL